MTEPDASAETMPTATIEFEGRTVEVVLPDPAQILVWKRTLTKLQAANIKEWTGAEVLKALERLRLIIDSIIVNDMDKDWIDDQLLAKKITIKELAKIPTLAAEAFAPQNRAARREAAKKTAPARRVAAKKTTPSRRKAS